MDHLDDLVDLYEYRVEDLLQGRTPKGGKQALLRLRQLLIQSRLPGPLAKRFRQADARFRAQRRALAPEAQAPVELPAIAVPEEPEPPPPEASPLAALALKVWRLQVERDVKARLEALLAGRREELRLIHAFLDNFALYRETPGFKRDFNLSRFVPTRPIPSLSDTLVDLDNPKVAQALVVDFLETARELPKLLPLPPEETRTYVRRFLNRLLEWEGAYNLPPKPDLPALRRALEEALEEGLARQEERFRGLYRDRCEALAERRHELKARKEALRRLREEAEALVA